MNRPNLKLFSIFVIGLLTAFTIMYVYNNYKIEKKNPVTQNTDDSLNRKNNPEDQEQGKVSTSQNSENINELTEQSKVIDYVKTNHELPAFYLTKSEAKKMGWIPSKGNLCDVLPGKAIGGDRFSNREKQLSGNAQFYEADVNYTCGNRNADRIVFTKNGEVYLTKDHYSSFQKQ